MLLISNIDISIHIALDVGYKQNHTKNPYISRKDDKMNTLGLLETLLISGMITEEEYKDRKTVYVESLLELYCIGILSKEELYEKMNQ